VNIAEGNAKYTAPDRLGEGPVPHQTSGDIQEQEQEQERCTAHGMLVDG
jgi:hypothetical protein